MPFGPENAFWPHWHWVGLQIGANAKSSISRFARDTVEEDTHHWQICTCPGSADKGTGLHGHPAHEKVNRISSYDVEEEQSAIECPKIDARLMSYMSR